MGGGGGSQRQVTTNDPPRELRGAYSAFGDMATDVFNQFGPSLMGYINDQTPQQIAGPTGLETAAYEGQMGLMGSQGPQAWADALGMFNRAGNLPQFQGADFSGISGWAPAQGQGQGQGQAAAGKSTYAGGGGNEPGGGNLYGGGGDAGRAGAAGLDPSQAGGSALSPTTTTPGGATPPPYTEASNQGGIPPQWQGGAVPTGQYGLEKWMGGGGAGGGSFSAGGGGGSLKDLQLPETIGNPLENIDFANHPALRSALDTFAKTSLPGIENSMIGAGLGRSGAAGNAIATGKAQIALPVMQQLMNLEMQNKGLDTGQRATDIGAQVGARGQDASLSAAGMGANASMYGSNNALRAALAGQETAMRGQDINALLANAGMGLESRGMDVNALLGAAGGLSSLGGADLQRIRDDISGAMGIGGEFRNIENAANESEFNAANRPFERFMDFLGPIAGGAVGSGGTTTTTSGAGGK